MKCGQRKRAKNIDADNLPSAGMILMRLTLSEPCYRRIIRKNTVLEDSNEKDSKNILELNARSSMCDKEHI